MLSSFFGIKPIWGSSNNNALSGLKKMARYLKSGQNICITPDGPRGPARKVAPGVIAVANMTGATIVPVTWSSSRIKRAKSWDRMMLPLPFAKGRIILGKPINITLKNKDDDIQKACLDLEDALNDITAEADMQFGYSAEHLERRYGPEKVKV